MDQFSRAFDFFLSQYRIHILVLLISFFIAITLTHPSFFVNDEWITANQLSQLHDGKQLMFNEGKYGFYENGTASYYFKLKNNILGYSLFLPLISLPAYWMLDLTGDHWVIFLNYLWTFLLIGIALFINNFFPRYAHCGKWHWTSGLIIGAFILFFLNFYYYHPFFVTGKGSYPEILAIGFTHTILFAVITVMIYEIIHSIFTDTTYSIFGTFVCVSSSSYIFWISFCKDHLLVVFLFTVIVLFVVKVLQKCSIWCLNWAFFFSGLLAWARPELALFVCISLSFISIWMYYLSKGDSFPQQDRRFLLVSPVFTMIGAIPFFINNYMFTKNILVPTSVLWRTASSAVSGNIVNSTPDTTDVFGKMVSIVFNGINIQPATFFTDLYGIFFNPQTGALGLFPVMPLVLVALALLPVLVIIENVRFTPNEKRVLIAMTILASSVFIAYFRDLHGMNTSIGINPDMRYLSPMYLPLNIIGLLVLAKVPIVTNNTKNLLKWIIAVSITIIPMSLFAIAWYYPFPELFENLFPLLNLWISIVDYLMIILVLMIIVYVNILKKNGNLLIIPLAVLCTLPLIWQIDATFLMRYYGTGFGGYSFWIPVILKIFAAIFG